MTLVYARKNNGKRILVESNFHHADTTFSEFDLGRIRHDERLNPVGGSFVSYHDWWCFHDRCWSSVCDLFDCLVSIGRPPHAESHGHLILDGPLTYPVQA